jgi:hypothetical protein
MSDIITPSINSFFGYEAWKETIEHCFQLSRSPTYLDTDPETIAVVQAILLATNKSFNVSIINSDIFVTARK